MNQIIQNQHVDQHQKGYNRPVLILRSTLYWLWLVGCTLFMAAPVIVTGLFSKKAGRQLAATWAAMNLFGLKHICGLTCKISGEENIPDTACIVLSKHQSTFETLFIPVLLNDFVFVAKRSLTLIPIFGWAIYLLKFILIDRTSGTSAVTQMLQQSKARIAEGTHVVIFPEGTRTRVNAPPRYRAGGAVVASRIKADVLPIAHNSGEFWPRMGFIKWPGEISMHIGPVIKTQDKTQQQIINEAQSWIESRMAEITVTDRFPY